MGRQIWILTHRFQFAQEEKQTIFFFLERGTGLLEASYLDFHEFYANSNKHKVNLSADCIFEVKFGLVILEFNMKTILHRHADMRTKGRGKHALLYVESERGLDFYFKEKNSSSNSTAESSDNA